MKDIEIVIKAEEIQKKLNIPVLDDANAIASKLESLQGVHRLNIGAVAGLDDYAKVRKNAMQKKIVKNIYTGGSGYGTFVPYTGATSNTDLGSYSITASNLSGNNTGDQNLSNLVPYTGATTTVNLGVNKITFDYAGSTPASGPSIEWGNGTYVKTLGLYVSAGLNYQGNSTNAEFKVCAPTTDGTIGTAMVTLNGGSGNKLDVNGDAIFGDSGGNGRIVITDSAGTWNADIYTPDNVNLRITNSGTGSTGASLQLKDSAQNYLFSFEGHGGFRYWARNLYKPTFIVTNAGEMQAIGPGNSYFTGNLGIGTTTPTSKLQVVGLTVYASNATAITGGLTVGAFYRTGGDPDLVCVVH